MACSFRFLLHRVNNIVLQDERIQKELRNINAHENLRTHKVAGIQPLENEVMEEEDSVAEDGQMSSEASLSDLNTPGGIYKPKLEDVDLSNYSEVQRIFISKLIDAKKRTGLFTFCSILYVDQLLATNKESVGLPNGQGGSFGLPPFTGGTLNYPIPRHSLDYAQTLFLEKKVSYSEEQRD